MDIADARVLQDKLLELIDRVMPPPSDEATSQET
jgi:hypothetical protein